ncbi:MAG: sulfur carrier protein ThiS [Candidatus Aminicenantes bacterium]
MVKFRPEKDKKMITVNNRPVVWEEGMTVTRLLEKMNYTFRLLVVKINGQLVKRKDYDRTEIPSGADVKVLHMVAGG